MDTLLRKQVSLSRDIKKWEVKRVTPKVPQISLGNKGGKERGEKGGGRRKREKERIFNRKDFLKAEKNI